MDDISKQAPQTVQVVECPPRRQARPADPCVMVIFGASGDLTSRLILPALYNLARTGLLPENFAVIGVARSEQSSEAWRRELQDAVKSFVGRTAAEIDSDEIDEAAWRCVARHLTYISGDLTKPDVYAKLRDAIGAADKAASAKGNVLFYLAVADRLFGTVVDELGKAKLTEQEEDESGNPKFWRRVVVEKPFGHSFESARALDARILRTLHEDQIFRIDHFLGKETVQNIMALRFANGLFEPIWNRDRIDHVQITAAETIGIGTRGRFYEVTGALRDMVPNHLFTLLSMVAMEPPTSFGAAEIRSKKFDVFSAMPAVKVKRTVRGQYGTGTVQGKKVAGYRDEPNVAPDSKTETYVALEVEVDNWRWAGVPFYMRTGKRLGYRNTEIAICFKHAPHTAFRDTPVEALRPNWLVLRIQPNEGISLQFEVKRPGPEMDADAVAPAVSRWGRLVARLRAALKPLPPGRKYGKVLPVPRTLALWDEEWRSTSDRLEGVETGLKATGTVYRHGGGFDRWDIEVRGGMFGGARMRSAIEEHGGGRQLVRFRVWPRASHFAQLGLLLCVFALSWAIALSHTVLTAVFAAAVLVVLSRVLLETSSAVAALLPALRHPPKADLGSESDAPAEPKAILRLVPNEPDA